MTSNYCSAVWTVIKLGGFKNPGTCECPYLPEVCPRPVRCRERSSPRPDAEITAEIPVTAWVFENVGENITLNELQRRFTNPSRTGTRNLYLFLLFWIPAHHLALNASSVGGHQSHVKPLFWSQQDQVDFLLLRGLSHGKRIQKWSIYLENKGIIFNVGTLEIESCRPCAYLIHSYGAV